MIRRLVTLILISSFMAVCYADALGDLHSALLAKKRDIYASELTIDEKDSAAFWKVYDEYEQKQLEHSIDAINLMRKFNDKYATGKIDIQSMVNMQAEFFRIEGRKLQTKQNHAEFFSNVLSKEDVFRFYQIEKKVDALIRSNIAEQTPIFAPEVSLK